MRRILLAIFILFCNNSADAQISVSGAFLSDTIVIGDEVSLTLSIEANQNIEILGVASFFLDSVYSVLQSIRAQADTSQPLIPMIADFELMSSGGWSDDNEDGVFSGEELNWSITESGTRRLFENTFIFKLWDPGETIVLFPTIVYLENGVQEQFTKEQQIKVFVAPPGGLPAIQDSLTVAPIKNIREEPINFSDYLPYFIIISIALIFGLTYWLYTRYLKRKEEQLLLIEEPEIYIPPHIIALEKLTLLQSKELWQQGNIKTYQSELTHIIREYLEGRFQIAALESTTDEIVKSLMEELSNNEDVISLKRILQVADLVKFAKAKPDENVHESFMNEAVDFVERTKQIEEEITADD